MSVDLDIEVYTAAVDFDPVLWAVFCDLCSKQLCEGTQDEALDGRLEAEHKAVHAGLSVAEYRVLRRGKK